MTHLSAEPLAESRRRKKLRTNAISGWELRLGDYRIFYDADESTGVVSIKLVGVKRHEKLYVRGVEHRI